MENKVWNKRKVLLIYIISMILMGILTGRLMYLMIFRAEYYQMQAKQLHEREREIKAARGKIVDRNGKVLASNKPVCTISVIHSQIKEPEKVAKILSRELDQPYSTIKNKVCKVSSREKIKSNVPKKTGDKIRKYRLDGVKVDEDFKRFYLYDELASKIIGFTGADNQGILGLEVKYDQWLKGNNGKILTVTDARGIEIKTWEEGRIEPVKGYDLCINIDYNIQKFAQQASEKVMKEKEAGSVITMVMNPQNGEIYAYTEVPEYNLNQPFKTGHEETDPCEKQKILNDMWRNKGISDTYEPGSVFKIVTAAAALEEKTVSMSERFYCPGYRMVEDRKIRCAKVGGHGSQTFLQGIQNSCNPVFIEVGLRLGVEKFYDYLEKFKLYDKTGIDLPGEAGTIMHKKENVGPVELATMSFGQCFQVTPIQMAATICSLINGGNRITPHLGRFIVDDSGRKIKEISCGKENRIVSKKTSEQLRMALEKVVTEGGGKKAYIDGYRIGGKTATSQTFPRGTGRYISAFAGFAPADNPKVMAMTIIYYPKGVYYGGLTAAPVVKEIFENILPYLRIPAGGEYTEREKSRRE